ncbi:MAG: acyl-CoA dehydrogenase family protein [Candidatus Binataceae bacterium]
MISFDLTDEQRMIRDTVVSFAAAEIRPAARAADESDEIPGGLITRLWELGLVRGQIPEQFGGYGDARSALTGALVAEELAYGDLSITLHALAPRLFAFPVLEMGTDEQRARFLAAFGTDAFVPASAALMEPRFDFDAASMATVARAEGSGFCLSGIKCGVPIADICDKLLIYAATGGAGDADRVQGFIVPRGADGVTVSVREKNMGLKGLGTYEVKLDNCHVGRDAKLGGDSGINFTRLLSETRVAAAAMAVGVARAAFDYARDYAKERRAFGVPIATKQAIAFMLAEMAIEIDAMRLLAWEAAARLDHGQDALVESYQARNYSAASSLTVTDNAVQILGGHGYIREHPVEMWLRNARGFAVLEGLATV